MSIVINLTDQQREDLIVTAIEGGSNYWYFLSDDAVKIIKEATVRYKKRYSLIYPALGCNQKWCGRSNP